MGNLWMLFKKYGTVFDMFMVQKRLRSGQRYGFVHFKLVLDVNVLLKNLRNIRFGEEHLKVFIAFDRRSTNGRSKVGNRGLGSNFNTKSSNIFNNVGVRSNIQDGRRFADVVSGDRIADNKAKAKVEERVEDKVIVVSEEEVCSELFNRSLIGEVKSLCYLTKMMGICDELGLGKVEIKLLAGLEVMLIFDTAETTTNILNDIHHGIRRWIHKSVFRKIAVVHGRVMGLRNCKLEGNQSVIIGKVQIHLVKEKLNVMCMEKMFKVEVIEEVGDIEEFEIEELKDDESDRNSNNGSDEDGGDSDSEDGGSNDSDNGDRGSQTVVERDQKKKEEEESRLSLGTRVYETPEVEGTKSDADENTNGYVKEVKKVVNNDEDGGPRNLNLDDLKIRNCLGISCCQVDDLQIKDGSIYQKCGGSGPMNAMGHETDDLVEQNNNQKSSQQTPKGEKRAQSPVNSNYSDYQRTNKKRKSNDDGIKGLGDNTKGISEAYKEYHEVINDNNGTFIFKGSGHADSSSKSCSINMEYVKEIGEIIGVSWSKAEEERNKEVASGDEKRVGGIISINVRGMGEAGKKGWVNSIIRDERPDVIGLQETKMDVVDEAWVEELWGSRGFGLTQLSANGNSSGILLIWDSSSISFKDVRGDERFVAVKGEWKGRVGDVFLGCIYGPHVGSQKMSLWNRLLGVMGGWIGAWCLFGDSNVVRRSSDRLNSQVCFREMEEFNDFINVAKLIEVPMGSSLWGHLSVVALDRKLSDHCLIVLKDIDLDSGPKPFRTFDIWLEDSDIGSVVETTWNLEVRSNRLDCRFRDKLKNVKMTLRKWSKERFGAPKERIEAYKKEAMRWELEAENRILDENERATWMEARKQWVTKENEFGNMLGQKDRVKWDVEGDENSKFFHAFIKRRNNKSNIRGLMVNGVEKISIDEANLLEKDFNEGEIWDAIRGWFADNTEITKGCNSSFVTIIPKVADSIGLGDFRPISLIGCYYKIIAKLLAERVKRVVGKVVGDVQNAFIKGRYILDGILIANETVDYLKKSKEKGLILKVDFEKAYDSMNWRFLIDIMKRMTFEDKWCNWVECCLRSASMSILVNGSPTEEFSLGRGVRQGDALSPLFILATEGLNAIVNEAVENGIFRGVKVGRNRVVVSHLHYADDTIFFGEWNKENAKALMCILKCFEEVSELRVKYNKSKLYGVGVNDLELGEMARWMGCGVGDFPFTYLGLLIGENMRRVGAWSTVVKKFKNLLSEWKAKTMSFGGRLTLVKSVLGSLPLYYFSMFRVPLSVIKHLERVRKNFFWGGVGDHKKLAWVKWDKVLASHGDGGLNIGPLRAKNLALLGKWWWRFKKEGGSLWVRIIKSIHGESGGLGEVREVSNGGGGIWREISKVGEELEGLGIDFVSSFKGEVGDGSDIRFWVDRWIGDVRPIRGRVHRELDGLQDVLHSVVVCNDYRDRSKWTLNEDGEFTVKELTKMIEEKIWRVENGGQVTLWNKRVPKKVNIFIWRALQGKLPVREELDKRGIDLDSLLCPCCDTLVESCNHSLVLCDLAWSV
ncbi:putative RNA-directed DNA polymerase [Tanacetum coccineum]